MHPSGRNLLANIIFSPLNCIKYGVSGSYALSLFNATYSEGAAINPNTNRFSENVTSYDKNGASAANEYVYDTNGNLTKDSNKGITGIQYNVLNLPSSISFSDGSSITYTYAADGTKLRT